MSKDDDFCSHCGSAVWGEDYVSQDVSIRCDTMEGHSHDKVTYSKSERGEGVHIPEGYEPYNPTNSGNTYKSGKKPKAGKVISAGVVIYFVLKAVIKILKTFLEQYQ